MRKSLAVLPILFVHACGLIGTTNYCDPASPLYPYLTEAEKAECEMGETGDESLTAWCFRSIEAPSDPDMAMRDWCYPTEPADSRYYIEVECTAVFDFDAWNYDGSCDPGAGCASKPETARICFGPGEADTVEDKPPGDQSVRMCWENSGDLYPTLYIETQYVDESMHEPLCVPQYDVPDVGPLCTHDKGAVCLSHNLFCACKCTSDADCESPSVCEGYYPGEQSPSFCVYSEP